MLEKEEVQTKTFLPTMDLPVKFPKNFAGVLADFILLHAVTVDQHVTNLFPQYNMPYLSLEHICFFSFFMT